LTVKRVVAVSCFVILILSVVIGCRYAVSGSAGFLFQPARPTSSTTGETTAKVYEKDDVEAVATSPPATTVPSEVSRSWTESAIPVTTTTEPRMTTEKVTPAKTSRAQTATTSRPLKTTQKPSTTTVKTTPKKETQTTVATTTTTTTTTATTTTTTAAVQHFCDDYEQRVVELVNKERAKENLPPLQMSASLRESARVRAKEIVNSWGHNRPDGKSFSSVIKLSYCIACENLAAGQRTPEAVVKGWMNSPGHAKNIMNPKLTHIGVGCYYDSSSNYKYYWGQLFIAP